MKKHRKFSVVLLLGALILIWEADEGRSAPKDGTAMQTKTNKKITQADRQAAADRAAADGFALPEASTMQMVMPGTAPRYFSHPNYANSPLASNGVSQWNAFAQDFLQPSGMPMGMGGVSMAASFVYLSYMHCAIYDALVAIEGGYTPYAYTAAATDATASRDAAIAASAYTVLENYFPLGDTTEVDPLLKETYDAAIAAIVDSPEKKAGITIGEAF